MDIIINVDTTLVTTGIREDGISVYKKFVKSKVSKEYFDKNNLTDEEKMTIIFPDNIKMIPVSFVKGFIEGTLDYIDRSDFYEYFIIKGNEYIVKDFKDGVYY